MNNLSGIIHREYIDTTTKLNILYTNTNSNQLLRIIKKLNHKILSYDDLYFGNNIPDLIICNDRIISHKKISIISLQFHVPVIVVDHERLTDIIDANKIDLINKIPSCYSIAINNEVYESWNKIQDRILETDISKIDQWKDLIIDKAKGTFTL